MTLPPDSALIVDEAVEEAIKADRAMLGVELRQLDNAIFDINEAYRAFKRMTALYALGLIGVTAYLSWLIWRH